MTGKIIYIAGTATAERRKLPRFLRLVARLWMKRRTAMRTTHHLMRLNDLNDHSLRDIGLYRDQIQDFLLRREEVLFRPVMDAPPNVGSSRDAARPVATRNVAGAQRVDAGRAKADAL